MIQGKVAEPAAAFAARLAARAERIAQARARAALLVRQGSTERRWRRAALLWPLFGQD
ncbi:MAG: hypothetical protein ABW203_06165 [Novosphingobium sp.]